MDRGLPASREARAGAFRHAREDDPHDAPGGAARGGADQPARACVAGRALPAPARLLGQARAGAAEAAEAAEVGIGGRPAALREAPTATLVATIAGFERPNV